MTSEAYVKNSHGNVVQDITVQRRDVSTFLHDDPTDRSVLTSWTNSFVGSRLPQWRDIIRNGGNATTAYSASQSILSSEWMNAYSERTYADQSSTITWRRLRWMFGHYFPPGIVAPPMPPASVVTRVTNRCIRNFISRCDSARSSFEGGQDLGEYKATIHSIEHPMDSLFNLTNSYLSKLKKAKRRYRGKPKSIAAVLADSYLEWHFGIKPLIEDVASAVVDANRFRFPIYPITSSASERYSYIDSSRAPFSPSLYGLNLYYNTQSYGIYSVRYKGGIKSGADDQGNISVAQAWQLYPRNWAPTAWDLLPWTWLTDYFVNVGDIIRGLSFIASDLSWGSKTIHLDLVRSAQLVDTDLFGVPIGPTHLTILKRYVRGGNVSYIQRTVTRDSLSGSDFIPSLEFSFPTRFSQIVNMVAILAQRASKIVALF